MGFNYGFERKKMEARFAQFRRDCKEAGMSEEDIEKMYRFDRETLNGERRFRTHNQSLDGFFFADGDEAEEGQSPLLERHLEKFGVRQPEIGEWGRHDWIEDIDTPELARRLKSLSAADKELLACMVVDDMRRSDLSRKTGISRAAVTNKTNRIKRILREIHPEG